MTPKAKNITRGKVSSRMVRPVSPHSDRPFLFRTSPVSSSVRDFLPFAVNPGQHDLERAYRSLRKHFDTYAKVYATKDQPLRQGTKKAELRDRVISTGNRLSNTVFSAFRAVLKPMDISQHWSTTPIEQDLMNPDKTLLLAMATGRVRRIQAVIPIPAGSTAKSILVAIDDGDPLPLIQRVLGRPLRQEEHLALSAAERRAEVRIGEGLQEATCLLAATGLLQGAGLLRATHQKHNYRISFGDALITSESIGLADMVQALVRADAEDEGDWVCTPDTDLLGDGPSVFIQAVGFTVDTEWTDVVAAPWMSLFPELFGTKPLLQGEEGPSQATKRRLTKYGTSLPGYIVLEGLDFGNRRILGEVHAALKSEEASRFADIQNRLSELRYDTRDRWSARSYRSSSAPQYAGRDLLPWEDPGETDVSFPERASRLGFVRPGPLLRPENKKTAPVGRD